MAIQVEVFSSPGCSRCARAKDELRKIVEEFGGDRIQWRDVNVLEDIDYTVSMGVLSTPAIAIDGKLIFGSLPSAKRLRKALEERLESGEREK